jgi:O-antigen ligase
MKTGLGYAILLITVLIALVRNPRFAVFGMVACDTIRPGDEFIEFGMETVRFSITYYAVALGLLIVFYKRYRITSDRFHWAILLLFMSVVNSVLHAPCFGPGLVQIDNYYKMLLQYYLICAFMRNDGQLRELFWAISTASSVVAMRFVYGKFHLNERNFEGATGDRNEMAMTMVMTVPFLFMLGLTTKRMYVRLFAWFWILPLALTVLFSLSRGGMLGLGAVGGYLLYRLHHKRWLVVVGVMVALVGLANLPTEVTARFMTIGRASKTDASAIGRLNAWSAARNMAKDRPLWGMGSALVALPTVGRAGLRGPRHLALSGGDVLARRELVRDAYGAHPQEGVDRAALHACRGEGVVDRLRPLRCVSLPGGHGFLLPPARDHLALHGVRRGIREDVLPGAGGAEGRRAADVARRDRRSAHEPTADAGSVNPSATEQRLWTP